MTTKPKPKTCGKTSEENAKAKAEAEAAEAKAKAEEEAEAEAILKPGTEANEAQWLKYLLAGGTRGWVSQPGSPGAAEDEDQLPANPPCLGDTEDDRHSWGLATEYDSATDCGGDHDEQKQVPDAVWGCAQAKKTCWH